MGKKAVIRQGDRTSHGGTVLEGHQLLMVYGKPAAGIGHKASCPKCSGTITIVEGAMNATMMGINVAVEGMKTSCGATLVATQFTATIEYGSASPAAVPEAAASQATATLAAMVLAAASASAASAADADKGKYDEQVRLIDADRKPIASVPYHITDESGKVYKGLTDANGCCERVHTANAESLHVLTDVPALEKWR